MLILQGWMLLILIRIAVSLSEHNDSYPEPDGRSGTHVPIKWYSGTDLLSGLHLSFSSSVFCLSSHSPLPYLFSALQLSAPEPLHISVSEFVVLSFCPRSSLIAGLDRVLV